jgi:3-deoxy-manno-octulosonate cytidylyltransferase (CMP-KDO synthetase)
MKAIGIIPARLAASRFPNKPLAKLHGMPMVGHCYHRTRLAPNVHGAYVATCDEEIAAYVRSIGGTPIMTSNEHRRAATRTAEAVGHVEKLIGERVDIVIMVQGDEPLILPETIGGTLNHFGDPSVEIVNVMARIRTLEDFVDRNNVKVVVNHQGDALYFSREPIPSPWKGIEGVPMFLQTGIIAFRREVLEWFNQMSETRLEQIESIDMNRVIESGGRIRMVPSESVTFGVDTPEELKEAEGLLTNDSTLVRYLRP